MSSVSLYGYAATTNAVGDEPEWQGLSTGDSTPHVDQANPLLSILNPDTHYEAFQSIRPHLSSGSIVSLSRVCKQLSGLYRHLLPKEWDIDQHLSRFVKDPIRLRSEMAKTGALITSDVATEFFARAIWQESILEIFLQLGEHAFNCEEYIMDIEGYTDQTSGNSEFEDVDPVG
ncbi:MAG: hypothetical protein LQ338_000188 [Usnochroma carphineum]|nr:MAG: hypothetical protein LQ338_000188 [Usnochroma carphineum]